MEAIAASKLHQLKFPPTTWVELCLIENRLRVVDRLADLLDKERGYPLTYLALRDVAGAIVGWGRGNAANGLCGCDYPAGHEVWGHGSFTGLDGMAAMDHGSMPSPNEVEAWLRTSVAYDLALDHVIELTG